MGKVATYEYNERQILDSNISKVTLYLFELLTSLLNLLVLKMVQNYNWNLRKTQLSFHLHQAALSAVMLLDMRIGIHTVIIKLYFLNCLPPVSPEVT